VEPLLYPLRFEPIFRSKKVCGEVIENRGGQITFSALGQQAPLDEKKKWDSDFAKRTKIKVILDTLIPDFSVRVGGATSVDVTKPGIDKAYGVRKLRDFLGISLNEMIFIGDALFAGGNDYPAERAALEPEASYEQRSDGGSGCEDPRITFVEPLQRYIMTYTAFSPEGPRIALALSADLFHWQHLGLATFGPYHGTEVGDVDDKDARLFPVTIPNLPGHPDLAMLHRPLFPGTGQEETAGHPMSRDVDLDRESFWISNCPMALVASEPYHLGHFACYHRLATPVSPWERRKLGGGTPPIMTRQGWLIVYHRVREVAEPSSGGHPLCYSAGVMVISKEHPRAVRYRSADPVLTPGLPQERHRVVPDVVCPTGIDRHNDLSSPDRFAVYYGMADNRIGVARLDLPDSLPPRGVPDPQEGKV
jgi:predicted GH43/DUF377 family glycosyl hydrolase